MTDKLPIKMFTEVFIRNTFMYDGAGQRVPARGKVISRQPSGDPTQPHYLVKVGEQFFDVTEQELSTTPWKEIHE